MTQEKTNGNGFIFKIMNLTNCNLNNYEWVETRKRLQQEIITILVFVLISVTGWKRLQGTYMYFYQKFAQKN